MKDEVIDELMALNQRIAEIEASEVQNRKSEEALQKERNKAEKYLDIAAVMMIAINADQKVTLINKKGCEILGYEQNEIIGKNWFDTFIPERVRDEIRETFIKLMAGEIEPVEYLENPVLTRTGEEKIIAWHDTLLRDQAGNITGTLSSGEDITERKHAEKEIKKIQTQLFQAQKMEAIGTLAGGVAHDLNNLLVPIQGNTELLMEKFDRDGPSYKYLKDIRRASMRAANLIRQLLLFSRRQPMEFTYLNVNKTIKDLLKMLNRLIGEDITIETYPKPDLWTVRADAGNIEQVIMNLAVNARDAMPKGGKLIIKTENATLNEDHRQVIPEVRCGKFVCLSVADTGIGMNKEIIQRIFEPFFSTKEIGKGTGLGLSVVHGIVKQHQGWINVDSKPGQGSTFKVYLPAFSVKPEDESKETISLPALQGSGQRILLVEDEEEVRKFVTRALGENGYVVFGAANAKETLDIFEREKGKFHLVFCDVVLPDENGLQLVNQILSRKPELPILLSSGYTDEKSQWSVIHKKGFLFLQKPYALVDLLRTIKKTVKPG
ncbi:MAG: ATP-binding protein [Candidatus Aerophobetes bacterium]|nr:ATP-binding protein [Candidatus Aerophobetes bacterium]